MPIVIVLLILIFVVLMFGPVGAGMLALFASAGIAVWATFVLVALFWSSGEWCCKRRSKTPPPP
jgi:hypothetical protein